MGESDVELTWNFSSGVALWDKDVVPSKGPDLVCRLRSLTEEVAGVRASELRGSGQLHKDREKEILA